MNLEKAHICEKLPTVVSFIHPSLWKSSVMPEWKLDFNKRGQSSTLPCRDNITRKRKIKNSSLSLSLKTKDKTKKKSVLLLTWFLFKKLFI